MKTKCILPLVLFLSVCLGMGGSVAFHGVADLDVQDSTIAAVAYFWKGDTMKYVRTRTVLTVDDGDTLSSDTTFSEEFMITVRDSTAKGYKMEYIPISSEFAEASTDDVGNRMMATLQDYFKDLRVVFTTDEYGTLKGLDNWKEIRDRMKGGIKIMLDSLYSTTDSLEEFMPRNQFEGLLTLMYSTEAGVLKAYDELTTLFLLHGNVFDIGRTTVDDTDKDSSFTTFYVGYEPFDEYGTELDYNIFGTTVTKYTADETGDMLSGVFNILLKDTIAGGLNKILKDSLDFGMTVTQLEDYHLFFNGWPSLMRTQKIVKFGPRTKIITDEIDWKYRSWRQYAVKNEEYNTTSF